MKTWINLIVILSPLIAAWAQKSKVELIIEPTRIEVGESIRITITSTVEGTYEIDNLPASFVQDYAISQGSHDKLDHSTGEVETFYYYSFSGTITKAGKYSIGPVYVKNLNKVYPSNKVTVTVDARSSAGTSNVITNKQMNDPAFGVISANKTEIYEGEALVVCARVYSHFNPSHISGYNTYNVPGAVDKHPIGNPNNIKVGIERLKGVDFYSFDYDKNVVFPSGIGKVSIEPYQLNLHQGYKSFPVNSGNLAVKVKALPPSPPASFIGAVGSMTFSAFIDSNNIRQGNVFTYLVKIEGSGNLNNIKEPKIDLPKGFVVYGDPEKEESLTMGLNGAEGSVTFSYHIQTLAHGSFTLPEMEISYFDPKKEKYVTLSGNRFNIEVERDPSIRDVVQDNPAQDDQNQSNQKSDADEKTKANNTIDWKNIALIGAPTLSLAALFFILFVRKRRKEEQNERSDASEQLLTLINHHDEIKNLMAQLKSESNQDTLHSLAQKCIQLCFQQITMSSEPLSRSAMLDYLQRTNQNNQIARLELILDQIEHSKYGFALADSSNINIAKESETLCQALLAS